MYTEGDRPPEDDPQSSALVRPSILMLILANLSPVYGVLVLGWKVFPVILLFWLENLIVGGMNVVRILAADPRNKMLWAGKLFLVPFFCIHYGLFTYVHGIFVMGFFGGMFRTGASFPGGEIVFQYIREYHLGWPILGLAASHVVSFVVNFVGQGEYLRTNPIILMQQPYGRVVVLHVTILAGGFLMMALHSPVVGMLLLVVLKTGLDLRSHMREHRISAPRRGAA